MNGTLPEAKLWLTLEQELFATGVEDTQSQKLFELARSLLLAHKEAPENGLDVDTLRAIVHLQPVAELQGSHEHEILSKLSARTTFLLKSRAAGVVSVIRDLADLSRDDEWRIPLGDAGFIELATNALSDARFYGSEWSPDIYYGLQTQVLRLVANLCADKDENRERAIQSGTLRAVLDKFSIQELLHLAVPAAFNICNDYENAKKVAIQDGLFIKCLQVLESGPIRAARFGLLLDIIGETIDPKDIPPNALTVLLKSGLQGDLETEERAGLLNLINKLLVDQDTQKDVIRRDQVELVLGCLFRTYTETQDVLEAIMIENEPELDSIMDSEDERESIDEKQLVWPRTTLVQILADISAHREFKEKYQTFTDVSMMVWKLKHIMPSPRVPIAQAACLMLGNLACSDEVCIRLVKDIAVHQAASDILGRTEDLQLLHAALGLLRNLALPVENKESLAMVGVIENLQKCWSSSINPQIQLAGASLMRQLLNGSLDNIQRALLMSSLAEDGSGTMQTQLAALIHVWTKTDELPIKTEIARTITAILRCLHGSSINAETRTATLAGLFLNHPVLEEPIIGMVLQSQYPVMRSEGWFALGLLARDEPGRQLILRHTSEPEFLKILKETIQSAAASSEPLQRNGDSNNAQELTRSSDGTVREPTKDRDNALLLIHELLKNRNEGVEHLQALISDTQAVP